MAAAISHFPEMWIHISAHEGLRTDTFSRIDPSELYNLRPIPQAEPLRKMISLIPLLGMLYAKYQCESMKKEIIRETGNVRTCRLIDIRNEYKTSVIVSCLEAIAFLVYCVAAGIYGMAITGYCLVLAIVYLGIAANEYRAILNNQELIDEILSSGRPPRIDLRLDRLPQ